MAQLLQADEDWRASRVNMLAGEGLMSLGARAMLGSDLATRLAEGLPGCRESSLPVELGRRVDEIEELLALTARRLFRTPHVEWRPLTNTMANAVAMSAIAAPGDLVLVQTIEGGGNLSYQQRGLAGLLGLRTAGLPTGADYTVDRARAVNAIQELQPRLIIVGGSKVLFPYPVREIRAAADAVGALIMYDAAHVAPHLAAGIFNDALVEGADIVTTGTHKIMGGPVGGLVLSARRELADRIRAEIHPRYVQTRDLNKYAAAAVSLAEMESHREHFAADTVANAKTLAAALSHRGWAILGADRDYTMTAMLVLNCGPAAQSIAHRLEASGILVSRTSLPGEDPEQSRGGIRISVGQVTRLGMGPDQMELLAELIDTAADRAGAALRRVRELAAGFRRVHYSFDK